MTECTIMYFDRVEKKVRKFMALEVDIETPGIWASGYWSGDDPRDTAKYFFPMDKIKYLKEGW